MRAIDWENWSLPCPMPLLPSEIRDLEEAQARTEKRAAKVKPEPMQSLKARVLTSFGFSSTKELKAALITKGHNLNLRLKSSWQTLDDSSCGIVWVLRQDAKRRAIDPKAIAARVDKKRAEVSLNFKYRLNMPVEELADMNHQAREFINQKISA